MCWQQAWLPQRYAARFVVFVRMHSPRSSHPIPSHLLCIPTSLPRWTFQEHSIHPANLPKMQKLLGSTVGWWQEDKHNLMRGIDRGAGTRHWGRDDGEDKLNQTIIDGGFNHSDTRCVHSNTRDWGLGWGVWACGRLSTLCVRTEQKQFSPAETPRQRRLGGVPSVTSGVHAAAG